MESLKKADEVTLPMDNSVLEKQGTTGKRKFYNSCGLPHELSTKSHFPLPTTADDSGRRTMYFTSKETPATAVVSFLVAGDDKKVVGNINTAKGSSYEIEGGVLVKLNNTLVGQYEGDGENCQTTMIFKHCKFKFQTR